MPEKTEPRFPFTAIVGQTAMKRSLILNAVNTRISGVLIRGKKGTAKSTAVRSLANLLPEVSVLRGCPYSCPPENRQGLCQWCQPQGRIRSRRYPTGPHRRPAGGRHRGPAGGVAGHRTSDQDRQPQL